MAVWRAAPRPARTVLAPIGSWAWTFGDLHERVEPRPKEFTLGRMRVKPLFAPRHGPEMEVMKQMLKAKKSIDFAMFTFASSSGIDLAMLRLVRAVPKLRIRGVLDREQGLREWAPTKALAAAGIELFVNAVGNGVRYALTEIERIIDDLAEPVPQ